jgi:hypothetical protein
LRLPGPGHRDRADADEPEQFGRLADGDRDVHGVTSRQAAERPYLRLRPSGTGEQTGEQRVRAHRDKRASDRAVAAWARDNAAVLRQLAGQVSPLSDLPNRARRHADLVGQALADNDPTSLLSPLADTHTHLKATHAGLAAQIQSITDQTTQIRPTTHATRSGSPRTAERRSNNRQ